MDILFFILMMVFGVLPCVLFGYLIKYRKKHNLIAGFNHSNVNNPDALGNRIGNLMFLTGALVLLLYIDIELNETLSAFGWVIFAILMVAPVALALRAASLDKKASIKQRP